MVLHAPVYVPFLLSFPELYGCTVLFQVVTG